MNQEPKQLPVPPLTPEQVQTLMNYANEKLPTMYGNDILKFIQSVAIELDKAQVQQVHSEEVTNIAQ